MSFNLLELAQGAIGQQVLGSIGGILGEDEKTTSKAISAGLPALIGGLIGKASTDQGTNDLFGMLDQQDDGILDNLGGMLGGGNHESFLGQGSGVLGSILGASQGGLVRLLCKATGLGDGKIATVLSILAPVVMGLLKRQRSKANLDAGGLGGLIKDQKRHIGSSLPAGVGDLFELGSLDLDEPGARRAPSRPPSGGGSILGKLLPLLLVLGLGIIVFKIVTRPKDNEPKPEDNQPVILDDNGPLGGIGVQDENDSGIRIDPTGPLATDPIENENDGGIILDLGAPSGEPGTTIEPGPLSPDN